MMEHSEPTREEKPPDTDQIEATRPEVELTHAEPSASEGHMKPLPAQTDSSGSGHTDTSESTEELPDVQRPDPYQTPRRLVDLALQMNRLEAQFDRLLAEMQHSGAQVTVLTRHLTTPETTQPHDEHLAALMSRMEEAQDKLEDLTRTMTQMKRVQFKSNTLSEGKEEQVTRALAMLQEIAARREQITETQTHVQQQHLADERAAARVAFAADLIPVLDGLDRALVSGLSLLESKPDPDDSPALPRQGIWDTVRMMFTADTSDPDPNVEIRTNLAAWLQGLDLVRERFLALLAIENIQPIPALNQPFDPQLHVATSTETHAGVQAGTILRVLRGGYSHGNHVLRYAEVVVARAPATTEPSPQSSEHANLASHEVHPLNHDPDA